MRFKWEFGQKKALQSFNDIIDIYNTWTLHWLQMIVVMVFVLVVKMMMVVDDGWSERIRRELIQRMNQGFETTPPPEKTKKQRQKTNHTLTKQNKKQEPLPHQSSLILMRGVMSHLNNELVILNEKTFLMYTTLGKP